LNKLNIRGAARAVHTGKTRIVCNIVVKIDQLNLMYWIAFPLSQTMWRRSVGWFTNRKRC